MRCAALELGELRQRCHLCVILIARERTLKGEYELKTRITESPLLQSPTLSKVFRNDQRMQ